MLRDMAKSRPGAMLPAGRHRHSADAPAETSRLLTARYWLRQCLRIVPMPEG